MPNREDVLREETHKGDVDTLDQRVYYTLTGKKGLEAHRIAKAVAGLVELLQKKGLLSEEDIDDFLFNLLG